MKPGKDGIWGGEGPLQSIMPDNLCSKAVIFIRITDSCSLEHCHDALSISVSLCPLWKAFGGCKLMAGKSTSNPENFKFISSLSKQPVSPVSTVHYIRRSYIFLHVS